jgi:hypothetical protein
MKATLVICGDSFNYGIGCSDLYTQPYGIKIAENLDWDCIRLARGSASNYTIYLQGIFAAKLSPKPKIIILGTTSYDRVEWISEGKEINYPPKLEDLNYHLYPPHYITPPLHDSPMSFYLKDKSDYDPKILSEQIVAFQDYFAICKKDNNNEYFKRLRSEPKQKLELIESYYIEIFNEWIKRDYDIGVIMLAYRAIKRANIQCIIVGPDYKYTKFIDQSQDFFPIDWSKLSNEYPDKVKSLHCSEEAHSIIAENLTNHIKQNFI